MEPYVDSCMMEIHHDKHHVAYTTNLNKVLESANFKADSIEKLLADLNAVPEAIRTAFRNHSGGHINHILFWEIMAKNASGESIGDLAAAINKGFGDFKTFKEKFSTAAATQFGSGWAWLSVKNGKLIVSSTPNQDSPISEGAIPILGIDVWEHAYYLKYQNRRPEYIEAWWNVVNWKAVTDKFHAALKK